MLHPSHYVIEKLGESLAHYEQELANAIAEIARLRALVEAPTVPVEQPEQ